MSRFALVFGVAMGLCPPGFAQQTFFTASLSGANVVPPVPACGGGGGGFGCSDGNGSTSAVLEPAESVGFFQLRFLGGEFQNLGTPADNPFLFGFAPVGSNDGTFAALLDTPSSGQTAGTFADGTTFFFSGANLQHVLDEQMYVTMGTSGFPLGEDPKTDLFNGTGGEIRGQLELAECFVAIGTSAGATPIHANGHTFWFQVGNVRGFEPVTLGAPAEVPIALPVQPAAPLAGGTMRHELGGHQRYVVQVMMWNPEVFPGLPEQWSQALVAWVLPNGELVTHRFGDTTGMEIAAELGRDVHGEAVLRFPFTIPGI